MLTLTAADCKRSLVNGIVPTSYMAASLVSVFVIDLLAHKILGVEKDSRTSLCIKSFSFIAITVTTAYLCPATVFIDFTGRKILEFLTLKIATGLTFSLINNHVHALPKLSLAFPILLWTMTTGSILGWANSRTLTLLASWVSLKEAYGIARKLQ